MSQLVERSNSAVLGYNLNDGGVARLRDSFTRHSIATTGNIYIYSVCVLCTDSRVYQVSFFSETYSTVCLVAKFFVMSVGFKLRPLTVVRVHKSAPGWHSKEAGCPINWGPCTLARVIVGQKRFRKPRKFMMRPHLGPDSLSDLRPITKLKLGQG